MDLEMKCPHCSQWISLGAKSCSECDLPLVESKEDANPLAPSKKAYGKLATGLIGVSLLAFTLFNYLKQDANEDGDQAAPAKSEIMVKQDLSEQLGYYGQWDKNKDGHLSGGEITETMTALNKLELQTADVNGRTRNFGWRPPQDIDLDNKLSRIDFLRGARDIAMARIYDLNGDDHLDEKEIVALREKVHLEDDLMAFDINEDNLVDLLEIPPTHLVMLGPRGPRERQSGDAFLSRLSGLPKQLRDRFDTDKDGKLSDSEKRKVSEALEASRRRQGRGVGGKAVRPSPRVSATGGPGVKGGGNKGIALDLNHSFSGGPGVKGGGNKGGPRGAK